MWMDDRIEQRIADEAYDAMKKNRENEKPNPSRHTTAAKVKVSLCMTCHAPVDWVDLGSTWEPRDHGTETPHRCKP